MGLLKKKNKQQKKETIYDIHTQLENARRDLGIRKQQELERNNSCVDMRQEIDIISGECEILQQKNRKRWRKVWVLCFLFLLLGIGVNVAASYYFSSTRESYVESLEREYNDKRAETEQKLYGEQQ